MAASAIGPDVAGHVALAFLTVGSGLLPTVAASASLGDVVSALLFLALAVPLAVALDDMGGEALLAHGTYRPTMMARSGQDPRGNGEPIGNVLVGAHATHRDLTIVTAAQSVGRFPLRSVRRGVYRVIYEIDDEDSAD